jgi:type IV pilus assembly protein PilE
MKSARWQRGFTLSEGMVVMVIIAVLSVIAMNAYGNYMTRNKVQAAKADLVALSLNLENELQRQLTYGVHDGIKTDDIVKAYKGWHPSQSNSFRYVLTSGATYYDLKAEGLSGPLSTCVLELRSDTTGAVAGNCGSVTTW